MSRPKSARAVSARAATISVVRLPLGEADVRPTFRRERAAMKRGVWPIAGCDEAGRGPLAGPVVAAAVVIDRRRFRGELRRVLDDSKVLSRDLRESCYAALVACARSGAVRIGVGAASRGEIDRINILRASLLAMCRAVAALRFTPDLALVDGNQAPPLLPARSRP